MTALSSLHHFFLFSLFCLDDVATSVTAEAHISSSLSFFIEKKQTIA